jgi:hypothetical protein
MVNPSSFLLTATAQNVICPATLDAKSGESCAKWRRWTAYGSTHQLASALIDQRVRHLLLLPPKAMSIRAWNSTTWSGLWEVN